MYQIVLFYKYIEIADPNAFMKYQRQLCSGLGLKGRLIIAKEGINGTFEGTKENIAKYVADLKADPRFADVHIKLSDGIGNAFPRLSIKVRPEIVSSHLGEKDIDPRVTTGKYLQADELHRWINEGKEFYIVDMRNDYEFEVGHFANSILPPLKNFRDLSGILPSIVSLKDKTVVTVCTGGVRCEKASGFLVKNGFNDVYQLFGGIVTYMEKYPNEDFKGTLYVFDGRITMGFNLKDTKHEVVGKCWLCKKPAERYLDCAYLHCRGKRHFICCDECKESKQGYCGWICKMKQKLGPVSLTFDRFYYKIGSIIKKYHVQKNHSTN